MLITYNLVSNKNYLYAESIVLGAGLMYSMMLPALTCSISQRYWHTINRYRHKTCYRKTVDPHPAAQSSIQSTEISTAYKKNGMLTIVYCWTLQFRLGNNPFMSSFFLSNSMSLYCDVTGIGLKTSSFLY